MNKAHAAARRFGFVAALVAAFAVAGCHRGAKDLPGDAQDHAPFHEIGDGEVIHFLGTEPFWGGEVTGTRMTYSTPGSPKGEVIPITRFAGRGGLSFTGLRGGEELTLAVAPGQCSDGMSDRAYPFTVMLKLGAETRQGCAWTDRQRPTGGEPSGGSEAR